MNLCCISKLVLSLLCLSQLAIAAEVSPIAEAVHELVRLGNTDMAVEFLLESDVTPSELAALPDDEGHVQFYDLMFPLQDGEWEEFMDSLLAAQAESLMDDIAQEHWHRIKRDGSGYNQVSLARAKADLETYIRTESQKVEARAVVQQSVPQSPTFGSAVTPSPHTRPQQARFTATVPVQSPRVNPSTTTFGSPMIVTPQSPTTGTAAPKKITINPLFQQAQPTSPNVPLPRGASRGGARNIMPTGPLITTGPVPECWAPNGYDVDPAKRNPFWLIGAVADDNPLEFSQKRNEARACYEVPLAHAATHEQAKIYVKAIDDAFELLKDPLRKQQWLREHPFTA